LCSFPNFGKRTGRKLDKTIGLKTVRISSRLTMEDSYIHQESGLIREGESHGLPVAPLGASLVVNSGMINQSGMINFHIKKSN
jgi:hypothetical protein